MPTSWDQTYHVGLSAAAHLICSGYEPTGVINKPTGKISVRFPSSAALIAALDRYQTVIDNLKARADRPATAS